MDTEEMYQRGVADAERGELHPFYYQHYYHYRRGYDRTRRFLRRPAIAREGGWRRMIVAIVVLFAVGAGVFTIWRMRSQPAVAPATAETMATEQVVPTVAVRTPIFPTPTPEPTPEPVLAIGGQAMIVNTEGRPLRGRQEPGLQAPVRVSFKEGEQVVIKDGPVEADGYVWWQLEGEGGVGWSAERSVDGVVWLEPIGN